MFSVCFSDVRYVFTKAGKILQKEKGSDTRDQRHEVPGPEAKRGPEKVFPSS